MVGSRRSLLNLDLMLLIIHLNHVLAFLEFFFVMTLYEHIDIFTVVKSLRAHEFDFGLVVRFFDIVNTILFGDCFLCKDIVEVSPACNGLLLLLGLFLFDVEFLLLL